MIAPGIAMMASPVAEKIIFFFQFLPVEYFKKIKQRGTFRVMNTLVIVLIAAVCLVAAYTLYGRWLARKWGIDIKAKTPAAQATSRLRRGERRENASIVLNESAGQR